MNISRTFIITTALLLISAQLFIGCSDIDETTDQKKPNILLILTDDMGYNDAGFQGSEDILTPNLDKLASNGVIFSDAHVTATVCSPSRAGIVTGRYQQRFGHEANVPPAEYGTDTTQVFLSDLLLENGYRTSINGKWHLGFLPEYHPNSRGFEHFYGFLGGHRTYFAHEYPEGHPRAMMHNREHAPFTGDYLTDVQGDSAIAFIEQSGDDPFFVFLSFLAPHAPMEATEEDLAMFQGHDRPEYAAMMWAMDRAVGNVVQRLEELGELDNTLIFFFSDNGGSPANYSSNYPLKGFKGNKFEGGTRVPYFIHWGDRIEGGQVFDGLTSALDVFPTSLEAAGIEIPDNLNLDGVSLLPFINGSVEGSPHDRLFFRKLEGAAVRDKLWKLIRLDDYGYVLYNLENDPYETEDVKEVYPDKFNELRAALEEWEEELIEPWWQESEPWQQVTREIHKSLMRNEPIKRISP